MTTEIRTFEGKTLYRYLPLTKEDKEDLEKFSAWNSSNNINVSKNYIDSIAHDKDHRLIYLLANKKLYATTPSGFNDPYDCLAEIDDNVADENLLKWFRLYFNNQSFCSKEWQQKENILSFDSPLENSLVGMKSQLERFTVHIPASTDCS